MLKWLKTKRELLEKIDRLETEKAELEYRLRAIHTDVEKGMQDPKRLYLTWLIAYIRSRYHQWELTLDDLNALRLFAYGNDQACQTNDHCAD